MLELSVWFTIYHWKYHHLFPEQMSRWFQEYISLMQRTCSFETMLALVIATVMWHIKLWATYTFFFSKVNIRNVIRARHLLSHVLEYWRWWYRYFRSKVNIWTLTWQQHSFSAHERMFLWKRRCFSDTKYLDLRGTLTPQSSDSCQMP